MGSLEDIQTPRDSLGANQSLLNQYMAYNSDAMRYGCFYCALRQFPRGRHNATFRFLNHKVLPPCSSSMPVPGGILLYELPQNQFLNIIMRQFSVANKIPSGGGRRKYVPRKAAVKLTDRARTYFKRYGFAYCRHCS